MASRRTGKFRIAGVAALAIAGLIVAGCGSSSSSSSTAATAAAATSSPSSSSSTSAATPAAKGIVVKTAKGASGTYLVGPNGRALYLWVADTGGKSSCSGACAGAWPPLVTKGSPTAGPGVTASDLGTTMRSDGTEEVTYKGHPLYYFVADKSAGSTSGQGSDSFGAKWWLVAPSGTKITAADSATGASSSTAPAAAGSSSTGSSSGGSWG